MGKVRQILVPNDGIGNGPGFFPAITHAFEPAINAAVLRAFCSADGRPVSAKSDEVVLPRKIIEALRHEPASRGQGGRNAFWFKVRFLLRAWF